MKQTTFRTLNYKSSNNYNETNNIQTLNYKSSNNYNETNNIQDIELPAIKQLQ